MGIFSSRSSFDLNVPGATVGDLRTAVTHAPKSFHAGLHESTDEMRLEMSRGWAFRHAGGSSAHAFLESWSGW